MKRRTVSASLVLVLGLQQAGAAPISVRSGEHSDFTRLVMTVPEDMTWALTEPARQVRLTLDDHEDGFDTTEVFSRIPTTRLSALTTASNSLILELNCDCAVRVFREGNRFLVVDIQDTDPVERDALTDFVGVQPSAARNSKLVNSTFGIGELLWSGIEGVEKPNSTNFPRKSDTQLPEPEQAGGELLQDMLGKLVVEVGNAATRGILDPVEVGEPSIPEEPIHSENENRIAQPDANAAFGALGSNLRITSSQDIQNQRNTDFSQLGLACPNPDAFGIETWGGSQPFHIEIGGARGALYHELDRIQVAAAFELARLYLYYGFGAEATETLSLLNEANESVNALNQIADILDHGATQSNGDLSRYTDCDSDVAFWALLAGTDLDPSHSVNSNAALRALDKLPDHLRYHLGPMLSDRFLQLGDTAAAEAALRNMNRLDAPPSGEAELAKASVQEAAGDTTASMDTLEDLVNENRPATPAALIKYVDQHLDAGEQIPADIALMVEAFASELRNDPLGPAMKRAYVLAAAKSNQFEKAFVGLASLEQRATAEFSVGVRSLVVSELVSNSSDTVFLEHMFSNVLDQVRLDVNVAKESAQRMFDLGFPDVALKIIQEYPQMLETDSGALLRAQIALEANEPLLALGFLGSQDTTQADIIRAQAFEQSGAVQQAYQILQNSGDDVSADTMAWLSTQWQDILTVATPVLGETVGISTSSLSNIASGDGMLEQSEAALLESADARVKLIRMLSSLPKPLTP